MTCDKCDGPAIVHLAEIKDGHRVQRHLCEACGAALIEPAIPVDVVNDAFAIDQRLPGRNGGVGGPDRAGG